MPTGDIVTDIIYELFISVTAEELRDLFHKIMNGDSLDQLAANGDTAAQYLQTNIVDAGFDPMSFTHHDWAQFDAAVETGPPVEDSFEIGSGGWNDPTDPTIP